MFHVPEYFTSISQRLSEVLADIGVNEKMVLKRRRSRLLVESMDNIVQTCRVFDHDLSGYHIGSQMEGTTTVGLGSDEDLFYSVNDINIIQDWTEWDIKKVNLMMVRDQSTSPGYCYLQRLRNNARFISNKVPNDSYIRVSKSSVMIKNSCMDKLIGVFGERNGPSCLIKGPSGYTGPTVDLVFALPCKSPPLYALNWLKGQKTRIWEDRSRCFVVPVASHVGDNKELEWRISTALAERYLTFSLNITQIRCYILMKMILKKYKSQCANTLTSYICKTVLFHCIDLTGSSFWLEHNLLQCFQYYLSVMLNCLLSNNCPHFLLRNNNLMAGRLIPQNKQTLLEILFHQMQSEGGALCEIEIDDLSRHILVKFSNIEHLDHLIHCSEISKQPYAVVTAITGIYASVFHDLISAKALKLFLAKLDLSPRISKRLSTFTTYGRLAQIQAVLINMFELILRMFLDRMWAFCETRSEIYETAYDLVSPLICTTIGSTTASWNIKFYQTAIQDAFDWIRAGLNSDIASSRLKLASVLYSLGDMYHGEQVLNDTEDLLQTDYVQCICSCWLREPTETKVEFNDFCYNESETIFSSAMSHCVQFLPLEINCIPKELQYEMFRLTAEDMPHVDMIYDQWMGMAVVDPLPYLYFLKYKINYTLQKTADKERALLELAKTAKEYVLGHRETAYNLLGQCMELENRPTDALHCYLKSRNVRERKNAANIHICRLLASIINA